MLSKSFLGNCVLVESYIEEGTSKSILNCKRQETSLSDIRAPYRLPALSPGLAYLDSLSALYQFFIIWRCLTLLVSKPTLKSHVLYQRYVTPRTSRGLFRTSKPTNTPLCRKVFVDAQRQHLGTEMPQDRVYQVAYYEHNRLLLLGLHPILQFSSSKSPCFVKFQNASS